MKNYEVSPPGEVWNAIVQELDERKSLASLTARMTAHEVAPPPASWQQIQATLNTNKKEATVKKITATGIVSWLSAAAILGFLLVGSYYFLNNSEQVPAINSDRSFSHNSDEKKTAIPEHTIHIKTVSPVKLAITSHYKRRAGNYYTAPEIERDLYWASIEEAEPIIVDKQNISIDPKPILNANGELIEDLSLVNPGNKKYINITAPNGEQTTISSKLAGALHYFGTDDTKNKNSNTWQQRINEWRQKVMQSGFIPASSNFLDILEFTELIDENF